MGKRPVARGAPCCWPARRQRREEITHFILRRSISSSIGQAADIKSATCGLALLAVTVNDSGGEEVDAFRGGHKDSSLTWTLLDEDLWITLVQFKISDTSCC